MFLEFLGKILDVEGLGGVDVGGSISRRRRGEGHLVVDIVGAVGFIEMQSVVVFAGLTLRRLT